MSGDQVTVGYIIGLSLFPHYTLHSVDGVQKLPYLPPSLPSLLLFYKGVRSWAISHKELTIYGFGDVKMTPV